MTFRGLLFTAIAKDNVKSAVVISSVTFGIGHIINLFNGSGMDLAGNMNMVFTSKDALLQFGWDCLNISIYNPDEEMRILFEKIAASEGMFWRKAD